MSNLYAVDAAREDCQRAVRRAWLLDLNWSGRIYRLSTEPVTMTDDRGIVRQYVGGILGDISAAQESNRSGSDDAAPSAGLLLALDGTDVAGRIAAGSRLQEARGNLYSVHIDADGNVIQSWQRRIAHIIDGRCSRPGFDGPNDPVSVVRITLEGQPAEDSTTLLDPLAIIDPLSWPQVPDDGEHQGKVYPIVIGQPGAFNNPDGTAGATSGSPGYPVTFDSGDVEYVLICGMDVSATTVKVFDTVGSNDTLDVILLQDGRGRFVSVVDLTGSSLDLTQDTYYVKWETGGGIRNPYDTGALERLGDVLRWVMGESPVPVNLSAFAAEDDLNRIRIAGFLNDNEASPYEVATDLLEMHPGARLRRDANGLRPVLRRLDYPDASCAGTIIAYTLNGLGERVPSPDFLPLEGEGWEYQLSEGDYVTDASMTFAKRVATGRYRRAIRCTHTPDPDLPEEFSTEYAVMAETRQALTSFQKPQSRRSTVEVDYIYDESSAGYAVAETVRQQGFDYRTRTYYAAFTYEHLRVNEVYLLDDDQPRPKPVQVEVVRKELVPWGVLITLALDDDPVRMGPRLV